MEQLLKVLVGSQAHGLADATSDHDYRGVFVTPTTTLLSLGMTAPGTERAEGRDDDVSWEVGHFLSLATKCNPTILETMLSPVYTATVWGEAIRALFPCVWNSKGVRDAFCGYGYNQRKRFLDNADKRRNKYATAYVRTLYNAWELLSTGTFHVTVVGTRIESICRKFRAGAYSIGEVIDTCAEWEQAVSDAYAANPDKQTDLERVNDLLLQIRKHYWE